MGSGEGQFVDYVLFFEVTVAQGAVFARVAAAGGRLIPCRPWRSRVCFLKVELNDVKVGNSRHRSRSLSRGRVSPRSEHRPLAVFCLWAHHPWDAERRWRTGPLRRSAHNSKEEAWAGAARG